MNVSNIRKVEERNDDGGRTQQAYRHIYMYMYMCRPGVLAKNPEWMRGGGT